MNAALRCAWRVAVVPEQPRPSPPASPCGVLRSRNAIATVAPDPQALPAMKTSCAVAFSTLRTVLLVALLAAPVVTGRGG
ncbi:hypothetical protein ACFOPN_13685 [Xanthomonas hyacinthi]|uniref:hypothetical protein n=1 Tax=Xanthomonas hyacinthi TaxID=56455 RepID=UPI0036221527